MSGGAGRMPSGGSLPVAAARPQVGVVGHIEWVTFAVVDRLPAAGEITHADQTFELEIGRASCRERV